MVTSNHKCLNEVVFVTTIGVLIIFELEPGHQGGIFMVPNVGLKIKPIQYLEAQKLRKAILAAIYIYPAYVEYQKKYGAKLRKLETLASC